MATTFDPTVGAVEIGVMISIFLFGLVSVQTFGYYKKFSNDPWQLRTFVGVIWTLELTHCALSAHSVYWVTVTNFGRTAVLNEIPPALGASVALSGIIGPAIQAFFAHRVLRLSRSWIIPSICWLLCILRCASLLVVTGASYTSDTLLHFKHKWDWILVTSLAISTAVDVLIAGSLCYFLWKRRDGAFARTTTVVDQLIMWSIQTGLLTSIGTVVMLILFLVVHNHAWLAVFFVISRLFSNSLMASLNARAKLRDLTQKVLSAERSHTSSGGRNPNTVTIEMVRTVQSHWADDVESSKPSGLMEPVDASRD